jgi:N-acetylglucosaminyl-diphospho-decaprenol L-rhamnosyltransferase
MKIQIVVVNYNTAKLLKPMIEAVQRSVGADFCFDITIVDNDSKDESREVIEETMPYARLIRNTRNVGFARANNQAMPYISGNYVLLLNTDAFVASDTLSKTIAFMDSNPRCGILGVRLEGRDGVLQPCCRYFPTPWNVFLARTGLNRIFKHAKLVDDMTWAHDSVRACDWVVGCYYLVRKELIDQIGLFDPRYFLYYEEVDHCFAAKKAGWDVMFYPHTTVVHIGGESAKSVGALTKGGRQLEAMQVESELLYFRKNLGLLAVCASLFLSVLAEVINMLKAAFRQRPIGFAQHWQRIKLASGLFVATRLGAVPTR